MHSSTSTLRRLRALTAITCGVFALGATATAATATRWETLEAIHRVENPHNRTTPGSRGELGAYQFRQETWRHYTSAPFRNALDRQASDAIAIKHYDWIKAGLEREGIEASVYNIALAWNAGIGAVTRGTAPSVARDYASRVSNIAFDMHSRASDVQVAAAPAPVPFQTASAPRFELGSLTLVAAYSSSTFPR